MDEVYSRGKMAIVKLFNDANSTIQMDDSENHKLFAKGIIPGTDVVSFDFTLEFAVRDGRYRVFIDVGKAQFSGTAAAFSEPAEVYCARSSKTKQRICYAMYDDVRNMVALIKDAIEQESPKSDW